MFSNKWKNEICFLCMCNKTPENLFHAATLGSPASKMTLLYVMENLAKSANQSIKLPTDIQLCIECSRKIVNFDAQWFLLLESIQKAINYLSMGLKEEAQDEEIANEIVNEIVEPQSSGLVIKEIKTVEPPTADYDLVEKLKRENAHNLFACLNKEKEIQTDVAIKEEEIIDDPLNADILKAATLEEQELHTLLFNKPPEPETTEKNDEINENDDMENNESDENVDKTALIKCYICALDFKTREESNEHIRQTHTKQLKFKCPDCTFAHENENHLIMHKNTHRGLLETQCPWCEKKYSTKKGAIRHMEIHMENQKYQCDKCGMGFTQHVHFHNHQMIHDGEENPLICEICKKRFKTIKTFRRHGRTHREDRPRYTCDQCGKVFVDKYTHTKHMRLHMKDIQMSNNTAKCKTATTTALNFNCIICNETFPDKPKLDEHMADNHDVIIQSSSSSSLPTNSVA